MTERLLGHAVGGHRSSMDRVLDAVSRLGLPSRLHDPTQFMACCPAHDDRTPSLSVKWTRGDRGGMVLLNCHGCGSHAVDIAAALGLSMEDLFDEPLPARESFRPRVGRSVRQRRTGQRRGKLGRLPQLMAGRRDVAADVSHEWVELETYPYVDAAGQLVQEVVRERCASCEVTHKRFRQQYLVDGRRRQRKPAGFVPVLYRLPQTLQAVATGGSVWLLEGEKDVATAERLQLVATTNVQGSQGFAAHYAEVFRGADVRVVLDRDDAGWDRGVAVHRALDGVAAQVRLFLPATTAVKSDLTDHVEAGHGVADLLLVHVEEVSAWASVTAVRRKLAAVEQALTETQAQLVAAEAAQVASSASERRRFARRWAQESEIRHEALSTALEEVEAHVACTGTAWAVDALEVGRDLLRQATTAARAAHEAVGLAVPPALQLHTTNASPEGASRSSQGSGGGGGGDEDASVPAASDDDGPRFEPRPRTEVRDGRTIQQPTFRIVDATIVQVSKERRRGRGSDDSWEDEEESLKLILGLDVRIVEMEYLEDDDTVDVDTPRLLGRESRADQAQLNPPAPAELSAIVVVFTHPVTEETMLLRITADQWRDSSWLESLPGQPDFDGKPSGLATIRRAIKAVSEGIRTTTRYRWTGWRRDDEGAWMYVHAGGAITPDGCRAVPVLLTGPLARYDLPDPCNDSARLRAAFVEDSAGMLTRLPARVAAPLLGQVYRSALGPNPWVLALIGSPGSYKTSLASLAMHHWGEQWDRRKPASSMSGNGDTLNALRIKLNSAKDALYWADDVAPTRDWAGAQKTLEEFARLVHNGEQRSRSTRDGLGVLDGTPPRSSALVTSEVMPRPGSGAQRMLVVPVQADQVDLDDLIALDADESRHGRALLMSSMLQWLARDLVAARARFLDQAVRYAAGLRHDGETVRQAEAFGHVWAGWLTVVDFLTEINAITTHERGQVLARVDAGLREAVVATTDPDVPTRTGARVRELICHALRSGLAYVDDVRTGEAPPWPLAGRLGWRRTQIGVDETGAGKYRPEARGVRFGYVLHDPGVHDGVAQLLVDSTALEQVLKATGAAMADAPQIDRGTAIRALYDEGVLIGEERAGTTPRYTVQRTLHCEDGRRQRMTALRLVELLGDAPDPDATRVAPTSSGGPPDSDATLSDPTTVEKPSRPTGAVALFGPFPVDSSPPVDSSQHVDSSQRAGLASVAPPFSGLTSPLEDQEYPVYEPVADAEGTLAGGEFVQPAQPCTACGGPCSMTYLGHVLHYICWKASTAASRANNATEPLMPAADGPATAAIPAAAENPPQPAATARKHAARPGRKTFAAPAAVADADGLWLPDGTRHDLPQPLTHVGHLAQLVDQLHLGTQVTDRRDEPGQIWVTRGVLAQLGIDVDKIPADPTKRVDAIRDLTRGADLVELARSDGWQLGGKGDCLGAWTRVWREGQRGVWVALIPAMNEDRAEIPVLGDAPAPATLARRVALFADALQAPWAMSAGATGIDLMITLRAKDRDRMFAAREPVGPARISTLEQDINWSRVPTPEEQSQPYLHAYDRGGSYVAGVAGLELGIGDPQHHPDGRKFDKKLPGYWKVEVPDAGDWRFPHPLNPRGSLPGRPVWVTTPGLALAYELEYEVPVLEAYTWAEHGRVLDPWYERIRDARTALDVDDVDAQAARDLLKVVYTRTIGMLGSEEWMRGRPGYDPARRHHIVAKARANIMRRILQIGQDSGRWPVAVTADTLVYTADVADPVAAWPGKAAQLGRGFGQFKPEASGVLVEQLPYLNGKDYRGKELLDHDWSRGN